ncbi:TlpA family protein disulfide reductase [Mucilaginibacter paludis]|nr:TlpA disulfide reductase family protein [Mucilaginibacter paludis]
MNNLSETRQQVVVKHSSFKFFVQPGQSPNYFTLYFPGMNAPNLYSNLISIGDNVVITGYKGQLNFAGKGSLTCKLLQSLTEIDHSYNYKYNWKIANMHINCALMDSSVFKQLSILEKYQGKVPANILAIIRGDILGKQESFKYAMVKHYYRAYPDSTADLLLSMSHYRNEIFSQSGYNQNEYASKSNFYTIGLIDSYRLDSCLLKGQSFALAKAYKYFKTKYAGEFRERIVSFLLYEEKENQLNNDIITNALGFVHNRNYRNVILKLKNTYSEGAYAYNFLLKDSLNNLHKMSDFKGKVVILDFWYTGCGACRKLSPILTSLEKEYIGKDVAFINISIDNHKKLWISSLRQNTYTSPLSTSLYTDGKMMDHPIIRYYNILSFPTLIVINKVGRITRNTISPLDDNGNDLRNLINDQLRF